MAIYHFSTKPVSRKHKSSVAVSAYINAEKYTDERTNRTFDYSNKKGVLDSQCYAFDENNNRVRLKNTTLWNASEQAEAKNKRQDSARTAREYIVAMPHELFKNDIATGVNCITDFCDKLAQKYNVAVEFALHDQDYDDQGNGNKNYHFHLITTTRAVTFDDQNNIVFGKKTAFEMSDSELKKIGEKRTKDQLIDIRKLWADVANKYLEKHDFDERIDHRTLKEQGLNRKPKIRLSMADSEKEKHGTRTKAGDYNRAIDQYIALKQELAEIEKSLKKYKVLERFERFGDTSNISEQSELFFEVFADDDDDDFYNTASAETLVFKPKTAPAPTTPVENNNAKNEAVERPAPMPPKQKEVIKNNDNKAKEVLATKATAPALDKKPQAQAQPSPGTTTPPQKTPIAEPPKQAKTAQQQALQTKPTPPTPPRPLKDDRAEDKAPVKPPIAQDGKLPPKAIDRKVIDLFNFKCFAQYFYFKNMQMTASNIKNHLANKLPIFFVAKHEADRLQREHEPNVRTQHQAQHERHFTSDLQQTIYDSLRYHCESKTTHEINQEHPLFKDYTSLKIGEFTAKYKLKLDDDSKADIDRRHAQLNELEQPPQPQEQAEKEKPQLTPNESAKLKGQSIKLN
jgi:hypothetical protein